MEKNLTRILERVYHLHNELSQQQHNDNTEEAKQQQPTTTTTAVSGLFVAVSRAGMEEKGTEAYESHKAYAIENLHTLNALTTTTTGHHESDDRTTTIDESNRSQLLRDIRERLPVFECGQRTLQDYYAAHPEVPDHGTLLQSVLNFHVAVQADVFVGVKGSSYSTDILTTRYWLGKGNANYRYTPTGIERVRGLPEPHGNCKGQQ